MNEGYNSNVSVNFTQEGWHTSIQGRRWLADGYLNRFLNAAPVRRLAARRVRVAPGTKVAVSKITVSPKAGTLTNPSTIAKAKTKNLACIWASDWWLSLGEKPCQKEIEVTNKEVW